MLDELEAHLGFTVVDRVRLSEVQVSGGVHTARIELDPWLEPLPDDVERDLSRAHLERFGEASAGLPDLVLFTGMTGLSAAHPHQLLETGFVQAARDAASRKLAAAPRTEDLLTEHVAALDTAPGSPR